jgi:hypothetical protein
MRPPVFRAIQITTYVLHVCAFILALCLQQPRGDLLVGSLSWKGVPLSTSLSVLR